MAAGKKLLADMRANPRDWRIGDIERLCAAFGIACVSPSKGSHYKISSTGMPAILAHRPIKPVYVRELVRFVDAVREKG